MGQGVVGGFCQVLMLDGKRRDQPLAPCPRA